jgi:hypothetical protein
MWGALSVERTGLSFTIAAGSSQRSHSRVRAPWDSRPYFTLSNLRLLISSPPTTRRVTVEVLDPASTRVDFPVWRRGRIHSESESESYVTTDGQSAILSWYKSPIRGLRPDFYFRTEYRIRLTLTFLIPWGALSDERTGLVLYVPLDLASTVFLGS